MASTPAPPRPQRTVFPLRTVLAIPVAGMLVILLLHLFLPKIGPVTGPGTMSPFTTVLGGGVAEADGAIPTGSVVDVNADLPAVRQLDPELRDALEKATEAAAGEGQVLHITSGWRSIRYQEELFDDAVATYGSRDAAREFVATAGTSSHVTGRAVDIGPLGAQLWLMEHGSTYGLCQMFVNERWHFELATTPGGTCPDMLPDASHL